MLFQRPTTDAEELGRLIASLDGTPAKQVEIESAVDGRFGRTVAIMVTDMCGFSATTRDFGIVEFLRRMHEVQTIVLPIVRHEQGQVLNTMADSVACLFPTMERALTAATRMTLALDQVNQASDAPDHYLSIGLGYGRILVIDHQHMFGDEVNHAAKLGEDLAGRREILLTPSAVQQLPEGVPLDVRRVEIGGAGVTAGVVDLDQWRDR